MAKKTYKLIKLGAMNLETGKLRGSFIIVKEPSKPKQGKVLDLTRKRYDPKQQKHVIWKKIK